MQNESHLFFCRSGLRSHRQYSLGPADISEARAPFAFWILLLAIWSAMNMLFVASDLFTLYVALELLTFAAVPLVSLDGLAETLQAALRYLIFAILGSSFIWVARRYSTAPMARSISPCCPNELTSIQRRLRHGADDGGTSRQDRASRSIQSDRRV